MDLTQLKTFVVVANEANLTRAADILCLSQPAVSAQIKALECELGVQLFQRNARGMSLTTQGKVLKQDAERALSAAKSVFSRAQTLREGLSGECRIGTISEPVILHLSEVLSHMIESHPNLTLVMSQSISGIVVDQILEEKIHGGYVIGVVDDPRIATLPVTPITLRIVAPYAWQDRVLNAKWEDIAQLPWITAPEKCSFSRIVKNMFAVHGLTPTSAVATDQEGTMRKLVGAGIGMALMREDMALDAEEKHELVIWPHGTEISHLNFIYLRSESDSPVVQALVQAIKEVWHLDS